MMMILKVSLRCRNSQCLQDVSLHLLPSLPSSTETMYFVRGRWNLDFLGSPPPHFTPENYA